MKSRKIFSTIILAAICAVGLSAQSIWKEAKNPSWKTATGAEQYERLMWQAVQKKDWLAVESHIASNFTYVDASGTKDKAQRVADLKQMTVSDPSITDARVTASGTDAIVTYTMAGNRYMSLWQQQKSGWVLVAMAVIPTK